MSIDAIFDASNWAAVPPHFWAVVFFVFGSIVGSFLNVCIYRLPLGLSVVSPPSHCPHCKYSIPWYLNIPLVTWVWLRGKCAKCGAAISSRYFLVELLTAVMFLTCWLLYGGQSVWLTLVYGLFVAGLLVGTFTDFEHLIIPDEITLGGIAAGLVLSLAVPAMHGATSRWISVGQSLLGIVVGWVLMLTILWGGKLVFGRHKIEFGEPTPLLFGEAGIAMPDETVAYQDLFYRKTDAVVLDAERVELIDRCYLKAQIRLSPTRLLIGEESFDPETVPCMQVVTRSLVLPREAMGFGDVKLMGAIGAFLGWKATLFSLATGSCIGALFGSTMILIGKREWANRIALVPYLALGAVAWVFGGKIVVSGWADYLLTPRLPF